ncbi:hypothetical protein E4U54_007401 [Claviceps lovelessii]|nr:hypothetical protein E4U54_007401 [Claviceps lovelessii]
MPPPPSGAQEAAQQGAQNMDIALSDQQACQQACQLCARRVLTMFGFAPGRMSRMSRMSRLPRTPPPSNDKCSSPARQPQKEHKPQCRTCLRQVPTLRHNTVNPSAPLPVWLVIRVSSGYIQYVEFRTSRDSAESIKSKPAHSLKAPPTGAISVCTQRVGARSRGFLVILPSIKPTR